MQKLNLILSPTKPGPDYVEVTPELANAWTDWVHRTNEFTRRLQTQLDQLKLAEGKELENSRDNSAK